MLVSWWCRHQQKRVGAVQDGRRGRVVHIRINKAKDMQKLFAEKGDRRAEIDMLTVEDVTFSRLYVDDRSLQGEFTSKIVVEETRFTY